MSTPSLYRSVPSNVTIGCCVAENDNTGPKNKRELQFVNVQIKKCVAITLRGEKPITDCAEAGLVSCARAGTAGGGKLRYYQRGGMSDRVKKILAHCLATATIAAIGGGGAYAGWMALSWLLTYFFPLCGAGILDQLGAVVIPPPRYNFWLDITRRRKMCVEPKSLDSSDGWCSCVILRVGNERENMGRCRTC